MPDKTKKKQNPAKVSLGTMRKSEKKNRREVNQERTDVVMRATGRADLASNKGKQMEPYRVRRNNK